MIHRDFNKTISVERFAAEVYLSPSYLRAIFRDDKKLTIFQSLQNYRMAKARQLLRQPYHHVKKIADACGYNDYGYFIR